MLLQELARRWREQNAFIATALRPGLTNEEMDALTTPLEIMLPAEAREWWGWHDGANPPLGRGVAAQLGPGDNLFLPLSAAVARCQEIRDMLRYAWGDDLGPHWKHGWLPITHTSSPIVIDCGGRFDDPVPVRKFVFEDPNSGADGVGSMGELIKIWIATIDSGGWSYNRDQGYWEQESEEKDARGRRLHLV